MGVPSGTEVFRRTLYLNIREGTQRERTNLETNLGVELEWERLLEEQASRIKQSEDIGGTITELTADQRDYLIEWGDGYYS